MAVRPKLGNPIAIQARAKAEDVKATLERFYRLQRRATDDVGWLALHYSCTRAKARKMLDGAKAILGEEGWPTEPAAERPY